MCTRVGTHQAADCFASVHARLFVCQVMHACMSVRMCLEHKCVGVCVMFVYVCVHVCVCVCVCARACVHACVRV